VRVESGAEGGDVPLVSKERFDDFEGRRRIKSAESSGGMEERSGCRGVEETARQGARDSPPVRDIKVYYTRKKGRKNGRNRRRCVRT